jgi:internalin A
VRNGEFVIEDMPEGRTLVVTGSWTAKAERAVERADVDGVWLNYARGFSEPDLSFVGEWPIRRLLVLDRKITDLSPLARLGGALEKLSIQAAPGTQVDLATLPNLTSLAAGWDEIRNSLHGPEALKEIVVLEYDEIDLQPLAVQPSLEHINLKAAPRLESLYGVDEFALRRFQVGLARELEDIDALVHTRGSLNKLAFETCLGLYDIENVGELTHLRFLGISDCGRIPSLGPLADLSELETLYAWGSTRVEDCDLTPLLRLPRLKEVRMRDRREYRPRVSEIVETLAAR